MGLLKKLKAKSVVAFNKVDEGAGKRIFSNTTGVVNSLNGRHLIVNSINSKMERDEPELFHLVKHGYTKHENSYDKNMIEELSKKYDELVENEDTSFAVAGDKGRVFGKGILNPEKNFPEISKLITKDVIEFLSKYYKGGFKVKNIFCGRNYNVPEELSKTERFSNFWHNDNDEVSQLKFFVYMSDVTEEDGPFRVQSKIRTKELIKMGFGNRDHYDIPMEVLEDPKYVDMFTGPKGTTMFGNVTTCLHRAGIPEKGHYRDMIQFIIIPSKKPFSEDWFADVESFDELKFYDPKTDKKYLITELKK